MKTKRVSLDLFNDSTPWLADGFGLGRNVNFSLQVKDLVKKIIKTELTPLQQELVAEYYGENISVTEIARRRGVNKSTVSRGLKAARERIGHSLRYGSFHMWESN